MRSRRCAREAALQALYACDSTDDWSDGVVESYFKLFNPVPEGSPAAPEFTQDQEPRLFAKALIAGIRENLVEIDGKIAESSTRWSIPRMSRVDRNIIRIATYELLFVSEIPANVSINEAIEVAKRFGSPDSPTFVNGVLDKIASKVRPKPTTEAAA